jgi:predicted outer membrane protein
LKSNKEDIMNRRDAFTLVAAASLLPASLSAAQAQAQAQPTGAQPGTGTQEAKYVTDTLMAGSSSLETSRVAISKATNPMVKRFAQFESAEQETIAQVLKDRANMADNAKPKMEAEGKAPIDKLHDVKTGPDFDKAYVEAQLEGHQRLLQIQEAYLSNGKDQAHRIIATMARGHIKEHLANLEMIRKDMAG